MGANEFPDRLLGNNIQPDRGLIQKQNFRLMQQRCDQLQLHAFAQGELADIDVQLVLHHQQFRQFADGALKPVVRNAVDFSVQLQRLACRQIPPKLIFLAQQQRELASIFIVPFPRRIAQNLGRAAGGIYQTRQHFERRGLARAIGAKKTHQFAGFDGEIDFVDGNGLLVLPMKQPLDRAGKPRLLFIRAERLGQAVNLNRRHGGDYQHRNGPA